MAQNSSVRPAGLFQRRGWIVLLRGLMAIAFGVLAFAWPGVTIPRLVMLFGLYALAHGVLSAAGAIGSRGQHGSLLLAIEAIVGITAGIATLRTSAGAPMAFVLLVWVWAIIAGALRIAEAIRNRKEIPGDVWLALSGIVTVVFGFMLVSHAFVGVVGLAFLIAAFAVICGVFEILLGWELRELRHGRA